MKGLLPLLCTLAFVMLGGDAGHAAGAPVELYQAKPIVTGTGEANRQIGFALALEDVLVKVSGDPRLLGDPRVKELAKDAGALVAEFHYRDRMEGIPIHDEQGSHDRPHDLTTIFAPEKIDAVLASLGSRPWTGDRPTLTLLLIVEHGDRHFVLSSGNAPGIDMRDSLANASVKMAIPVTLPSDAVLASVGLTESSKTKVDPIQLGIVALKTGGSVPLAGSLVWSDAELGWIADWVVGWNGRTYRWQIRGVSFDEAFRNAMRGAAQVLSGNGNPD